MTDLPQGWREVALGEVCRVYQPKTISTKELMDDGEYVVFGANGVIGRYDKFNHEESEVTVTCRGATCGTVNVTSPKAWITGNAMVCKPNDESLTKPLLALLLRSVDFTSVITGTAQPQITRSTLAPLLVRVPPLAEQERIVEILEEQFSRLDSALASVKAVREKAKAFRRSLLHTAFSGELTGGTEGWREVALGEVVTSVRKSYPLKPNEQYELWSVPSFADGKPEVVAGSEIKSGKLAVEAGDVLVSKINPRINRVWIVAPDKGLPQISSTEWLVARVKDLEVCKPLFLLNYLSAPKFREWITASASSVTGSHMRAKTEKILEQEIALPPLATQERIVSLLEEQFSRLDKALEVANQLEARIASERRSLLHSAFTGELTSQWRKTHV